MVSFSRIIKIHLPFLSSVSLKVATCYNWLAKLYKSDSILLNRNHGYVDNNPEQPINETLLMISWQSYPGRTKRENSKNVASGVGQKLDLKESKVNNFVIKQTNN